MVCLYIYIPGGCEECSVSHNFASCFTMSCGGCFSKHILYTAVIRGNLQSTMGDMAVLGISYIVHAKKHQQFRVVLG